MWYYAARRIMLAIPIAIGVTIICFCLVYVAPGDPVQNLLPPDANQADVAYLKLLLELGADPKHLARHGRLFRWQFDLMRRRGSRG